MADPSAAVDCRTPTPFQRCITIPGPVLGGTVSDHVQTLCDLEQGQTVRLTLTDGAAIEGRVNQFDYDEGRRLRLELSTDASGDRNRYQAVARAEGDEWSPVEVRRHDGGDGEWTELGALADVTPLDATQFREPEDDPGGRT